MKKLTLILLVLPLLFSCSKEWEGCTDNVALNFIEKAEKDDGSCIYTTLTFYADSTQYPGTSLDYIEITVNRTNIGSLSTIFPNGGPSNCNDVGTISYLFEDAGQVSWKSKIVLTNGTNNTKTGVASPSATEDCLLINAL